MAAEEAALAAKQADIERQIQGQEAMSRAFSGIEQGEEIENIFRKNPAIVYSPQFGQLYQASNLMEPSKASKTLVPNLAKSLPPEFRSEFLATASDPKYLNDPLGAYTAIEMKKNIADQRGRLRAMGVDVSKLKPDYYYTPEEESDFKSKLSIEAKMAEIEQKKSEERERDLQEAKKWALKRGAQENMVNLLDSPSAIYQLGASIGGSRSGTASRDIIDRRGKIFNIAKEELEDAKRDFRDSAYDEPDVVEAKKKMLDEAQARYNQAKSDFEGALIEPPMEEDGVMGMQLPDYAPYSPEFRAGFASAAGSPAFGVPLGGRSTVPAKGRVAGETATNITSPAAMGGGLPAPVPFMDTMKKGATQAPKIEDILKVTEEEVINDINSPDATDDTFMAAISDPNASEKVKTTALERLRQFAKSPKFPLGTTSREARNRIANLQEKIKEGEKLIRMGPEMDKYRKAWTAEKNDIASDIEAYAKSLGLDADLVAADLAKNEPLTDDPDNPFTIRDDFNKFLKGKLDKKSIKISPFEGSEFASEFGMEGAIPGFRSIGKGKTYSDVLNAYLGEKFGQNKPSTSNPVAPAVKPSNIKSITPIE